MEQLSTKDVGYGAGGERFRDGAWCAVSGSAAWDAGELAAWVRVVNEDQGVGEGFKASVCLLGAALGEDAVSGYEEVVARQHGTAGDGTAAGAGQYDIADDFRGAFEPYFVGGFLPLTAETLGCERHG